MSLLTHDLSFRNDDMLFVKISSMSVFSVWHSYFEIAVLHLCTTRTMVQLGRLGQGGEEVFTCYSYATRFLALAPYIASCKRMIVVCVHMNAIGELANRLRKQKDLRLSRLLSDDLDPMPDIVGPRLAPGWQSADIILTNDEDAAIEAATEDDLVVVFGAKRHRHTNPMIRRMLYRRKSTLCVTYH
jgi:hypothetical protein